MFVFEAGDHQVPLGSKHRFYFGVHHQRCVSPLKGRGLLKTPPWVSEMGEEGGAVQTQEERSRNPAFSQTDKQTTNSRIKAG